MTTSEQFNKKIDAMYPTHQEALAMLAKVDLLLHALGDRSYNAKISATRSQAPFLEILPFPNSTINLKLTANVVADVIIPDQTKIIRFWGVGEYYVTRNGQAELPTTDIPQTAENSRGILMSPEYAYWYVEGLHRLSVIAPANTNITVGCWQTLG